MTSTKQSDFVGVTQIADGSYIGLFADGTNTKISKSDFITALGVTGVINQVGAVTGAPVLYTDAGNYFIRNLEQGSGVRADLSPENGLKLSHTFVSGSGGVDVLTDTTSSTPKIRSLVGGQGISVISMNGNVRISETGAEGSTGTVIVNTLDDLPTPVLGVIELDGATTYDPQSIVDISPNRFLISSTATAIASNNRLSRGFSSDTTGALFTMTGALVVPVFEELLLSCSNGKVFDVQAGAGLIINDCVNFSSGAVSTIADSTNVSLRNYSILTSGASTVYGIAWSGTCLEVNISGGFHQNWTGTLYDFGTTVFTRGLIIAPGTRFSASSPSICIAGIEANLPVGTSGLITDNKFTGTATYLSGFDHTTGRWSLIDNQGVEDSAVYGGMGQTGNATTTTLLTNTPVQLAGTMIASDNLQRCSVNVSDQLEFENGQEVCGTAIAGVDFERVGSGTTELIFTLYKNGSVVEWTSGSAIQTNISMIAVALHVNIIAPVCYISGDVFDIRVERTSGTANLVADNVALVIS